MYKIIKSLVCVFALLALSQGFNSIAHAAENKATNAHYKFTDGVNRTWIAPEFWAKPLESWRLNSGRMEVALPVGNAVVYSLTHQMNAIEANFEMSVTIGKLEAKSKIGSAGFRLGAKSSLGDYRSPLVGECGIYAGFANNGGLFIGNPNSAKANTTIANVDSLVLTVKGFLEDAKYVLSLTASDTSGRELGNLTIPFDAKKLEGNLGVISQPGPTSYMKLEKKATQHWFDDWQISGAKITTNSEQTFGPILWSQYTLSRNTMKMTVQMAPVNTANDQQVHLQIKKNGSWNTIASNSIHKQARTTHFRVNQWDDTQDTPYRVSFSLKDEDNRVTDHYWEGTIRKDPKDKTLSVAGFTGNTDRVFPNTQLVKNVLIQNPALLFFSGDQIYEDTGGYHMRRRDDDDTILNYLGKWYLFGWAFRDLLKDRPSVIIPDDHDVYQGNIWGNGGNVITVSEHERGGYVMPVDFVNAVHRTQVSHHPDGYDPTPIKQNISVYYGDMIYGRVSFAIIADRMFKSGPKGTVNTGKGRPDWLMDTKIDPKSLDGKGLALLGDRQIKFLDHWASNWRGADMKCVLSQTIFCSLANYCGGGRTFVIADLDSNGWPQTGRNKALDSIRRGFGFMCAGDQHLSSIVHHGIDDYGDAGYSFCVPSICVGYPRSWLPDKEGRPVINRIDGLANTGNYLEGFGNRITVHAAGNPSGMRWSIKKSEPELEKKSHNKASGHGMVYFNKKDGTITMECYRLLFDAREAKAQDQFPGWPKTIKVQDNYGRRPEAWLPTLEFETVSNPVVQIIDEASNKIVYTLRVNTRSFSPKVFKPGKYTIKVGGQGNNKEKELKGVEAVAKANSMKVSF